MAKEGPEGQEKTEQPTSKRLSKSRDEGQVARSQELNYVAGLIAALLYFALNGANMIEGLRHLVYRLFAETSGLAVTSVSVIHILRGAVKDMMSILLPFMIMLTVVAVLSNVFQFGLLFTLKPMVPKTDKLNLVKGLKRLFALSQVVEIAKSVVKLVIISVVPYMVIAGEMDTMPLIMDMSVSSIMAYIGQVMLKILFYSSVVLALLAVFDLFYKRWKNNRDMMMSKQEVKDELKQSEGDPKVKAKIRRIQFEQLRKAMMDQVPKADVVVTNPIHYAVALKYDRLKMDAPTVVAKGARKLAEKIKQIARENNVPVIENKLLAQSLYKLVAVGEAIPDTLFKAVAEVLAYVYSRKEKQRTAAAGMR